MREAAGVLRGEGTPMDDHRASAAYRSAMLGTACSSSGTRTSAMSHLSERPDDAVVGLEIPHESAALHVTGARALHRRPGRPHPRRACTPGRSRRRTRTRGSPSCGSEPAYDVPGVVRVLTAADVPGVNDAGREARRAAVPDEVMYHGHAVCWVLGETLEAARLGAAAVEVDYEPLPALVERARGDRGGAASRAASRRSPAATSRPALAGAAHVFSGETEMAGQEHFYLETHCCLAHVDEAGQVFVQCSTQHPTETQEIVAHVLGAHSHDVTVQCLRMGGGFGGKEMQPHGYAAVAALGATLTGRPVRLRLNRTQDMTLTGKRHGFHAQWRVGFDADGRLQALDATLTSDGGWSLDLSEPVLARALCHVDNAYWIPHVRVNGRVAQTHKTSQTAFRGFGGPQGMLVIEDILGRCAPLLGIDPADLRRRNLYADGQATPYGQPVRHAHRRGRPRGTRCSTAAELARRAAEIAAFNAAHAHVKRGLAVTPVKFGISFNFTAFNQAGALVHVYKDGSVLVNHGGTEMGQGLHTKMLQVAATSLGVPLARVATGADPHRQGAEHLRHRGQLRRGPQRRRGEARLRADQWCGWPRSTPAAGCRGRSWSARPTSAACSCGRPASTAPRGCTGTPRTMRGDPFKYFAYGAAATEVEVDGFTGAYRTRRVDIVHDVGDSLSPLVDLGQIEGGFVQGAGWLTLEDLRWDTSDGPHRGRLATQAASTYKLPSIGEMPEELNVALLEQAHEDGAVYGSKAVGEPPLMLALSVREALRQAAAAFGPAGTSVDLAAPATPEAVYWAIEEARRPEQDAGHLVAGAPGVVPDQPEADAPLLHPRSEAVAARSPVSDQ